MKGRDERRSSLKRQAKEQNGSKQLKREQFKYDSKVLLLGIIVS